MLAQVLRKPYITAKVIKNPHIAITFLIDLQNDLQNL